MREINIWIQKGIGEHYWSDIGGSIIVYDEKEYIYQEFKKNFREKRNEPLVLYGIGNNTGELLSRIREYNIVGLMDGKRKDGVIWRKPILDYEDVKSLNVKTIVIIARPAVIGVIYHRISKFCMQNDIMIYDVKGTDLLNVYANKENDIPYFHQSMETLKEKIEKHKIISFDIFDTLIMRRVLYPTDVFSIVEMRAGFSRFSSLRIEAEKQLYEEKKNPSIDEIYERFQVLSGVSEQYRDELMRLELDTEMLCVVPRKNILELFNSIKGRKKIYLISDMYLPEKFISKLLNKCGYEGYEKIYISCEWKKTKGEGLLDFFAKETQAEGYGGCDCLHIGDNYVADIMNAKAAGLDAFHIMSALQLLENSCYRDILSEQLSVMDHITVGLLCEKAFNDPFALYGTKGKLKIDTMDEFAYILIAPMIFYFAVWLLQEISLFSCDYVLYPSRDAYLIKKICDKIREKQSFEKFPQGEYFYTSRRAVLAATMWDRDDIDHVSRMDFWGSISQLFEKRFALNIDPCAEEIKAEDKKALESYLDRYERDILQESRRERNNYIGYISDRGILKRDRIAFIDFVAAGKVQNGLEKLVIENDIQGFYFLRREPDKGEIDREIKVRSFYPSKGAFEIDFNVYKYYLFLEMILTSPEPTFHSVSDEGKITFMEENRTEEHREIVVRLQKSILDYVDVFLEICPDLVLCQVDKNIPDFILGFLDKESTTVDIPEVTSMVLTDEFYRQTFNIF